MLYKEVEINEKNGYLIPIGCLHYDSKSFSSDSEKKLRGYLSWVKEHSNARILLMGDLQDVSSRADKTSPYEQTPNGFTRLVELFTPYKNQIIGGLVGNHEARMVNYADINLTQMFCLNLGIPYLGKSAVIRFKINKRNDNKSNRFRQSYLFYAHHGTGGGATIGSKMNKITKLREVVEGADCYMTAHSHMLGAIPIDVFRPSLQGKKLEKHKVWFVDTGSYLDYGDSYAETKMYMPSHLGSPRIRLAGDKHDIHISL